jgi:hypothetical protein
MLLMPSRRSALTSRSCRALHASFGLGAVGQDGLDVQLAHGTLELGGLGVFRIMLGEDAVMVAV